MMKCGIALLLAFGLLMGSAGCMCSYLLYSTVKDSVTELLTDGAQTDVEPNPVDAALPDGLDLGAASPAHQDMTLDAMAYARPDIEGLEASLSDLEASLAAEADAQTLLAGYAAVQEAYGHAESMLSLADLLYSFDVTEPYYQQEYEWLYAALNEFDVRMTDVTIAILESDAGEAAMDAWGPEYTELAYRSDALNSAEIQTLLADEKALVFEYDALSNGFVFEESGRRWEYASMAEAYYAGEIDYDEYLRLYDAYNAAFNAKAGDIFVRMLAVRNEIAGKQGYGSYAAYGYDSYSRDYTVTDAKSLHTAVKQYIVPLYVSASEKLQDDLFELDDKSFSLSITLSALQEEIAGFSPELLEAFNYMLRNTLCSFTVDANKIDGSFTTYISDYGAPYLFTQWQGGRQDVCTLIHEFGHFSNFYLNASSGWNAGDSLDLAEVDSQGLELLMTDSYPALFGRDAENAERAMLVDAMYAVITGCMEDEFQQIAYENPSMTLKELNAAYLRLAEEYGMAELYGFTGTEWAAVPHTFQTPMYYISYGVSMLLALELYEEAQKDASAARNDYLSILHRPPFAALRTLAGQTGLSDPLSADTVRALSETLRRTLMGKSV